MRRKAGQLVPLELAICVSAADLRTKGEAEFHGYQIAKHLGDLEEQKLLTAYGTLYRALDRLEKMGMLQSRWEDAAIPARENRPGRRLYTLTGAADLVIQNARQEQRAPNKVVRRRLARA